MSRRNTNEKKGGNLFVSNKIIMILLCVSAIGFAAVALSMKFLSDKQKNEPAQNSQVVEETSEEESSSAPLIENDVLEPTKEEVNGDDLPQKYEEPKYEEPEKNKETLPDKTNKEEKDNKTENEKDTLKEDSPKTEKISYNFGSGIRGSFLNPETDFAVSGKGENEIKAEIDSSLENASNLGINTIFVELFSNDGAIFAGSGIKMSAPFDAFGYILEKSAEKNIDVYAVYDFSLSKSKEIKKKTTVTSSDVNFSVSALKDFANSYKKVKGIALKGYYSVNSSDGFSEYSLYGGGMGFDEFQKQSTLSLMKKAREAVFEVSPEIPVGIVADTVWANEDENKDGTKTKASFTALVDGNADTKLFVEKGLADFVLEQNLTSIKDSAVPFESQIKWWSDITKENDIPLFASHSSKKALEAKGNWSSPDELTRQALALKSYSNVLGSVFDSLKSLSDDKSGSTDLLLKFYDNKVKKEHILKDLAVTNPKKLTYTTFEPSVSFTGASDPNFKVEFNGKEIKTDQNGFFSVSADLKEGLNKFSFVHKGKTVTYNITRKIELLKEISPEGNIALDGNMQLPITAVAIDGATVWATVGGQKVPMVPDETKDDQNASHNGESNFRRYIGYYETPQATANVQKVGNITVYASWNGFQKSKQGAFVSVNKKPILEDGVLVRVITDDAMTFPTNKLDNDSSPQHFPLAKGTLAFTVGNELSFRTEKNTYTYYNLSSGQRVYSKDITPAPNEQISNDNKISGMTVSADYSYTDVILVTEQKVPYSCRYDGNSFKITFDYTVSVPNGMSLSKNPLFKSASWDGSRLTLGLRQSGVFLGVKTFYNNSGNLVFRFTNPPAGISGARITVDPGHHIKDPGAAGFNPYYPEQVVNWEIASKLAEELRNAGAVVNLLPTNTTVMTLDPRIASSKNFGSQLFISIHNNRASAGSATGTEVFYFNDFSKSFAQKASANVASALGTNNRGAKFAHYIVTKVMQYPGVLVECGFLSNREEYNKLLDESYQWQIARGIKNAAVSYFNSVSGGYGLVGTESTGADASTNNPSGNKDENSSSSSEQSGSSQDNTKDEIEELSFKKSRVHLSVGDEYKLSWETYPRNAGYSELIFESLDEDIATVDRHGIVTAVSEGDAEIVVRAKNFDLEDSCIIIVE